MVPVKNHGRFDLEHIVFPAIRAHQDALVFKPVDQVACHLGERIFILITQFNTEEQSLAPDIPNDGVFPLQFSQGRFQVISGLQGIFLQVFIFDHFQKKTPW